ncbi:GNAT family N-acetyltransferase [Devosia sp. A16]|uniref:GNAT family N-acetyltransferase n=1 Tax=Devosia sp. A16 TaxID=1736675 RepID=UPI0006D7C7C3|nr:GNAT family N-acetyltransferase [Devosia sp. A16]
MRLETERLILRSWESRDLAPLAAVLGDPEVRRFYPSTATPEQTRAQLDFSIDRQTVAGFHFGAAELRATGRFVGLVGLGYIPDETRAAIRGEPLVEIGWQLDKAFWGLGLAPEGARAWLDYGFGTLNLPEIVAFTYAGNLPSQRVMEKIGMMRDAKADFEHPRLAPGHPLRSHVVYRIANPALRHKQQ